MLEAPVRTLFFALLTLFAASGGLVLYWTRILPPSTGVDGGLLHIVYVLHLALGIGGSRVHICGLFSTLSKRSIDVGSSPTVDPTTCTEISPRREAASLKIASPRAPPHWRYLSPGSFAVCLLVPGRPHGHITTTNDRSTAYLSAPQRPAARLCECPYAEVVSCGFAMF